MVRETAERQNNDWCDDGKLIAGLAARGHVRVVRHNDTIVTVAFDRTGRDQLQTSKNLPTASVVQGGVGKFPEGITHRYIFDFGVLKSFVRGGSTSLAHILKDVKDLPLNPPPPREDEAVEGGAQWAKDPRNALKGDSGRTPLLRDPHRGGDRPR